MINPRPSALALSLLTIAGSVVAASETDSTPPFPARGNEPGWHLTISGNQLELTLDYGARQIEARLPKPVKSAGRRIHDVPEQQLKITISEQPCTDSMTGMPYPSTVVVEIENQRLSGCGGEPSALLEGPEWQVRALAGEPVPDQVAVTIQFLEDNRIAGSSGCNRFMGGYQLSGEGLSFGQVAGTMMACPDAQMETEQRFLELLQAVNRFEIGPEGELLLITSQERRIMAKH